MEPNNFERELKKKLENSTIQPSSKAWDQLEAMLDAADETKDKRNYNWIYIAASFVGLLIMSTVFFKGVETNEIDSVNPMVLEQTSAEGEPEKKVVVYEEAVEPLPTVKQVSKLNQVVAENTTIKAGSKQLSSIEKIVLINNPSKENYVVANSPENKASQLVNKNRYVTAEQLLAEVSDAKFETKASGKITEQSAKHISVDPNSLLSSAETELNQTFREVAIEKFSKNINAIKTVLVNRNYE